jgi:hypothetical protein
MGEEFSSWRDLSPKRETSPNLSFVFVDPDE